VFEAKPLFIAEEPPLIAEFVAGTLVAADAFWLCCIDENS
jgi:hypothetical protein